MRRPERKAPVRVGSMTISGVFFRTSPRGRSGHHLSTTEKVQPR
ncbi:MAG: hypothetical protein AVDCRST_MAG90-1678 [uncultured Microvirga sp.]|uniref:Uncharacterized protein n=1 Tax=uncultured Microvirga sp. TaxID=412392 RepID=A0A6J4LJZ8_9HYPH|nr:MAG: hypothetical protein AVDCRST_MAG90-1678 [uncultured Microvirga sp.]